MTTYLIDHINASTESINVEVAAKSEMIEQSTDTDSKTGDVISTYVLSSGDNAYPATVTYRVQASGSVAKPTRRVVVTLSTWATSDDGAGVVVKRPLTGSISFVLPADMTVELADMDDFIGNLFSFLYASATAGARSTTYLQKLLYGVPRVA
jgi:hypothetical protein